MKFVSKFVIVFLIPLFLCHCNPTQEQEQHKVQPSPSPAETVPSASPSLSARKIEIPLQKGEPAYGIKYPVYNDKGELTMQVDASAGEPLNESQIEFKDVQIAVFEDNKKYFIQMSRSQLNLDTRILASDTPATIYRDDFEIIGDTLEFNAKTRFSKMVGTVKMTIFSIEADQK
jgi:hypothetical protein